MHKQPVFTSTTISRNTLERQLVALGTEEFEFGIRNEASGKTIRRRWTQAQALRNLSWLRHKNATHSHIYLRPADSCGVALLDDIDSGTLSEIEADGVEPCCVVETSPFNHQLWVRVSNEPISPPLATAVGSVLASRYDGDPNSQDWRHLGRAVGFTNVKPGYVDEIGRYPFVRLKESRGKITPHNGDLLDAARQLMEQRAAIEKQRKALPPRRRVRIQRPNVDATTAYEEAWEYVANLHGRSMDASRADFAIVKHLLFAGYDTAEIEQAMQGDNHIQHRKRGHVNDYIQRTILAVEKSL